MAEESAVIRNPRVTFRRPIVDIPIMPNVLPVLRARSTTETPQFDLISTVKEAENPSNRISMDTTEIDYFRKFSRPSTNDVSSLHSESSINVFVQSLTSSDSEFVDTSGVSQTFERKFRDLASHDSALKKYKHKPLLERLAPVLRLLQILSLYPLPLDGFQRFNRVKNTSKALALWILLVVMITVTLAGGILYFMNISEFFNSDDSTNGFGFLLIGYIITGMKPCICLGYFVIFAARAWTHRKLLRRMMIMDNIFVKAFHVTPPVRVYQAWLFVACTLGFTIPLVVNVTDYVMQKEKVGVDPLLDFSLLFVPMLGVWSITPLAYFCLITKILRFWFEELHKALKNDITFKKRQLRWYYREYLKLSQLTRFAGHMFNPFVCYTIVWTVFTLCLTIYFITQSKSVNMSDITSDQEYWQMLKVMLIFNAIHCLMQVLLAVAYMFIVCIMGILTNESSRHNFAGVLQSQSKILSNVDSFQMNCFLQKIQQQWQWGLSVWSAIPMERSILFTLVSAIVTYALLLLRMNGGKCKASVSPETSMDQISSENLVMDDILNVCQKIMNKTLYDNATSVESNL